MSIHTISVSTSNSKCKDDFIAPIRKSNESWIESITNELVNLEEMWVPGQPNGGRLQNCTTFNAETGNFYDESCSYKSCFVCAWKREPVFKLRGLCDKTQIEQSYVLLPQFKYVFFYGFERNNILYEEKTGSWLIVEDNQSVEDLVDPANDMKSSKIVGTLNLDKSNNLMPIGNNFWNLTDRCNQMMPLKLTHVSIFHIHITYR